jgi:hypothetical protein
MNAVEHRLQLREPQGPKVAQKQAGLVGTGENWYFPWSIPPTPTCYREDDDEPI